MLLRCDELADLRRLPHDDRRAAIGNAVVEVGLGDPVRERHDARAEPLAAPVQLHRLGLVREDACDPISGSDAAGREPARDARRALAQLCVGQPLALAHERLRSGCALGRVEEAEREVHAPATSAIASTIGV